MQGNNIDIVDFTIDLIRKSKNKWLLVATEETYLDNSIMHTNIVIPDEIDKERINQYITEIKVAVSQEYYKEEISHIAKKYMCDGIILGSLEVHKMYGNEKIYKGIEIIDPLLEFAIFIENKWHFQNSKYSTLKQSKGMELT